MRTLIITSIILLFYWISATAKESAGDASSGAQKAKSCMACHHSPINLKDRGVDKIAKQIKAIQAGEKGHPPGLTELSEEDILDIARFLNDG